METYREKIVEHVGLVGLCLDEPPRARAEMDEHGDHHQDFQHSQHVGRDAQVVADKGDEFHDAFEPRNHLDGAQQPRDAQGLARAHDAQDSGIELSACGQHCVALLQEHILDKRHRDRRAEVEEKAADKAAAEQIVSGHLGQGVVVLALDGGAREESDHNLDKEEHIDKHVEVQGRRRRFAQGRLPEEADVKGGAEGRVHEQESRDDEPDRREGRLRVHELRARHAAVRLADAEHPQQEPALAELGVAHLADRELLRLHQLLLEADRLHLLL